MVFKDNEKHSLPFPRSAERKGIFLSVGFYELNYSLAEKRRESLGGDTMKPIEPPEAIMGRTRGQFSVTRAAFRTCGRAKGRLL